MFFTVFLAYCRYKSAPILPNFILLPYKNSRCASTTEPCFGCYIPFAGNAIWK